MNLWPGDALLMGLPFHPGLEMGPASSWKGGQERVTPWSGWAQGAAASQPGPITAGLEPGGPSRTAHSAPVMWLLCSEAWATGDLFPIRASLRLDVGRECAERVWGDHSLPSPGRR